MADDFRASLLGFQQQQQQQRQNTGFQALRGSVQNAGLSSISSFRDSATSVLGSIGIPIGNASGTPAEPSVVANECGLSRFQRMVLAVICGAAGGLSLMMSFFLLPVSVASPGKFALPNTVGGILVLTSFAFLRGPMTFMKNMFTWDRLPFTAAYCGSVFATLYAVLILKSYIWIILFSMMQLIALIWYYVSYLPGGANGLRWLTRTLTQSWNIGSRLPI